MEQPGPWKSFRRAWEDSTFWRSEQGCWKLQPTVLISQSDVFIMAQKPTPVPFGFLQSELSICKPNTKVHKYGMQDSRSYGFLIISLLKFTEVMTNSVEGIPGSACMLMSNEMTLAEFA